VDAVGDAVRAGVLGFGVLGVAVVGFGVGVAVVGGRVGVVLGSGRGTASWPESDWPPRRMTPSAVSSADSRAMLAAAATMIAARVRRVVRRGGPGWRPGSWSGPVCVMHVSL
jgi:hypothetical protein